MKYFSDVVGQNIVPQNKVKKWNSVQKQPSQSCSEEKVFWKYAANLQENSHAEVRFQ